MKALKIFPAHQAYRRIHGCVSRESSIYAVRQSRHAYRGEQFARRITISVGLDTRGRWDCTDVRHGWGPALYLRVFPARWEGNVKAKRGRKEEEEKNAQRISNREVQGTTTLAMRLIRAGRYGVSLYLPLSPWHYKSDSAPFVDNLTAAHSTLLFEQPVNYAGRNAFVNKPSRGETGIGLGSMHNVACVMSK
ncbi:hypothetical protein KM043_002275 [Ampulex compressa]|nr:hypothetical protein KM043_002275 [Ampulex compressa]